jgi:integrase
MVSGISLYYGRTAESLTQEELDKYLAEKVQGKISTFKHLIHGLRYYYKALGIKKKQFHLPAIKKGRPLPEILNAEECKRLFHAPTRLRDKVMLCLIYSAGLRSCELRALRIKDIDSGRMLIHIRQSKNHKDRYVPLSGIILRGLRGYYRQERPKDYLFPGQMEGSSLSSTTLSQILSKAAKGQVLERKSRSTPYDIPVRHICWKWG